MEFNINSQNKQIELIIHQSENFVQFTDEFNTIFNLIKKHSVMDYKIKFTIDKPKIKSDGDKQLLVEKAQVVTSSHSENIDDLFFDNDDLKQKKPRNFDEEIPSSHSFKNIKFNI